MSTIYLIDRETSVGTGNLATGDIFLIYDTSAKAVRSATASNIMELVSSTLLSSSAPTFASATITTTAKVGTFATSLVSFFGATVTTQPAATNQAAPSATAAVSALGSTIGTTIWGYSTSTQANTLALCVIELRTALVALGLIKGSV